MALRPVRPGARGGLLLAPLLGLQVAVFAMTPVPVNDELELVAAIQRLLDGRYAVPGATAR